MQRTTGDRPARESITRVSPRRLARGLWAHRHLFFLNGLLLSPLLIQALHTRDGALEATDPVVAWNLVCSVTLLTAAHLLIRKARTLHLLLLPFYLVVAVELFVLEHYDSRLTAGYIWIILANQSNWREYATQFRWSMAVVLLLVALTYAWSLWRIGGLTLRAPRRLWLVPAALACALYVGLAVRQMRTHGYTFGRALTDVTEHDFGSPFGVLAQSSVVYAIIDDRDVNVERRNQFTFGAQRAAPVGRETYVMVVGETARADRWSITGYERDTSPRLREVENLVAFSDVITPWPVTQRSVPIMLSRATVEDFDRVTTERSILSAYHETGFETYWLTTQPFDRFAGYIYLLAGDADFTKYHSRAYDRRMLEEVYSIVESDSEKLFIVIHTMGSHIEYTNRYPAQFERFPVTGPLSDKERLDNEFDNTIAYTDSFLADLIARLRERGGISALLYCSDHGENLMDDDRNLLGHNYSNVHDLRVPLFFWYSDAYARQYPEKIENVLRNRTAPLTTENVFHSLADLGDIEFPGLDRELSVFRTPLRRAPRVFVTADGELRDFDADVPRSDARAPATP